MHVPQGRPGVVLVRGRHPQPHYRRVVATNLRTDGSIHGMKVSVSLPGKDVEFLDLYAVEQGLDSRSAALQRAVRLLRVSELAASYESAWEEWSSQGNAEAWEATAGDGLAGGSPPVGGAPGEGRT